MRAEENKAAGRIRAQDAAVDWSMKGKTVLFTGASRGMGRFAEIEFARLGAEVLIVGHNQARGAAAAEAIRLAGGSAQFLRADMGEAADIDALMHPGQADPRKASSQRGRYQMRSYQTAKLAVTTWTYGLARRW
jgi:NAD(P)-dependent dehydrogenase (short-subunit alcohol dehydrogenase family)